MVITPSISVSLVAHNLRTHDTGRDTIVEEHGTNNFIAMIWGMIFVLNKYNTSFVDKGA